MASTTSKPAPPAALGFSVHTGWAAAVLLAGPLEEPRVLARVRVLLADEEHFDESRFVYHASQEKTLVEAERAVRATTKMARRHAEKAVADLIATAHEQRHRVIGGGVALAPRKLPGLADILRTHALIHAAEGELFGRALVEAGEAAGLQTMTVPPREIAARAAAALKVKEAALADRITALGKRAGRPWAQDQRMAAMLGLIVLGR
jgi:hypothetical protein